VELYSGQQTEVNNEILLIPENLNDPSIIDKVRAQLMRDTKDFCLIIDNVQYYQNQEWLSDMSRILSRIQMAMAHLDLPQQQIEYAALDEADNRFELYCTLKEKLGDLDGYWMNYDLRTELDDQSGSLAGDLSDLYFEFKRSLALTGDLDKGNSSIINDQSILQWTTGYLLNWGQHLMNAQTHLYTLKATQRF
jgi:hypothetical protein